MSADEESDLVTGILGRHVGGLAADPSSDLGLARNLDSGVSPEFEDWWRQALAEISRPAAGGGDFATKSGGGSPPRHSASGRREPSWADSVLDHLDKLISYSNSRQ